MKDASGRYVVQWEDAVGQIKQEWYADPYIALGAYDGTRQRLSYTPRLAQKVQLFIACDVEQMRRVKGEGDAEGDCGK